MAGLCSGHASRSPKNADLNDGHRAASEWRINQIGGIDGSVPLHHGFFNHAVLPCTQVERVARSLPQLLLRWRPL